MPRNGSSRGKRRREKLRWAVIGQGHFAQTSILPAFGHARENSELVALFSGDDKKRKQLGRRYDVEFSLPYEELDDFLRSGQVQAAYVAVPNHLHKDITVRAAKAGVHVLCEKPMAVTARECRDMIAACEDNDVKLMIAYRLHFQSLHLHAIHAAGAGRLGKVRTIHGDLTLTVKDPDNIRLNPRELGGGPLYDLGIYCINAARYVFRAEPESVFAFEARPNATRYAKVEESICGVLKFPEERLCTFQCSVGTAPLSDLRILGTKGDLYIESAFDYAEGMTRHLTVNEKTTSKRFPKQDQFAPELVYFSNCILKRREPEPSGQEGLLDVRIIRALHESAASGKAVKLSPIEKRKRPVLAQAMTKPPVTEPREIHAEGPGD
jgi:predicted dehydrogenase